LPGSVQAAVRSWPAFHLRRPGSRRILQAVSRDDAALASRAARKGAGRALRDDRHGSRAAGPPDTRSLRPPVGGIGGALPRDGGSGAHGELGAGAPADLSRGARQVAPLREAPRYLEGRAPSDHRGTAGGGAERGTLRGSEHALTRP